MKNITPITSAPKRAMKWKQMPENINGTVINLKTRTAEIIKERERIFRERAKKNLSKFLQWINEYFVLWISCSTLEEKQDLLDCGKYFWRLLINLEYDKEYSIGVLKSDFEMLDLEQRFHHTFMKYLYDHEDTLVLKNLRRCVRELAQENPKEPIYKIINENMNTILETIINLKYASKIDFDLSYMKLI